jgi:hypothetical protein
MLLWLDRFPLWLLVLLVVFMALAPFVPEPHLSEKLKMLAAGTLTRPIDILDLLMHAAPMALLGIRLGRMYRRSGGAGRP